MPSLLLFLLSCTAQELGGPAPLEPDPSASWVPLSEADLGGGDKDTDSGSEYAACGPEVGWGGSCEGDWTTTLCEDDKGELWWCENGTWQSGK
jgi:hypothetical protein